MRLATRFWRVFRAFQRSKPASSPLQTDGRYVTAQEHLALAETGLLRQLSENSVAAQAPPASRDRERAILNSNGGNRDQKAKAPERACPTGRFGRLAEAAKQFAAARGRTIDYILACNDDLRMRTTAHPLMGPMNCMELLAFIIVHPLRHAHQVREIKRNAGYPRCAVQNTRA